ncbi:MAG: type VI secretion system accessory protein TagJ [Thiolinea sp.]
MAEALAGVEAQVRSQPGQVRHRILLFQLLLIQGQWTRAGKQLDVIRKLDDGALAMVHMYQAAISCELLRESVFRGEHDPVFMGQPQAWQALLLQAFHLHNQGRHSEAAALRDQAFEQAPAIPGVVDGTDFAWVADADMRLGPVLEMIVEGRYLWVAFDRLQQLVLEAPVDLRDLVWLPGYARWQNGGESPVLVPARYPGSVVDNALALGRKTEWQEAAPGVWTGLGQKQLATDVSDLPLLELREMTLAVSEPETLTGVAGGHLGE